jgi:hypothetical protein
MTKRADLFLEILDASADALDGDTLAGLRKLAGIGAGLYQTHLDGSDHLERMFYGPASSPRSEPQEPPEPQSWEPKSTCTKCGFKAQLGAPRCPKCGNESFYEPIQPG